MEVQERYLQWGALHWSCGCNQRSDAWRCYCSYHGHVRLQGGEEERVCFDELRLQQDLRVHTHTHNIKSHGEIQNSVNITACIHTYRNLLDVSLCWRTGGGGEDGRCGQTLDLSLDGNRLNALWRAGSNGHRLGRALLRDYCKLQFKCYSL